MTYNFNPSRLVEIRKEKFWTQEDLSIASGVSVRTIQRIEREGGGSVETWKALAASFELDISEFGTLAPNPRYSAAERKQAMFGVTIGCAGGLLGCGFAWWSLLQVPAGALNVYPVLTVYVSFATAICFVVPIYFYRRTRK